MGSGCAQRDQFLLLHSTLHRARRNKALEKLESLKDYFLGLWTEVADKVTEFDRVRIIHKVVTGTKGTSFNSTLEMDYISSDIMQCR